MFNFSWFDELFPNHFLTCENLAIFSILTTKKVSSCYVKQGKQDELKRPTFDQNKYRYQYGLISANIR